MADSYIQQLKANLNTTESLKNPRHHLSRPWSSPLRGTATNDFNYSGLTKTSSVYSMCFENYCFFSMTSIKELDLHSQRDAFAHWSNTLKVYFSKKSNFDFPHKYVRIWQPIILTLGYGRSCIWELFGMTHIQCVLKIIAWFYGHQCLSLSCQKFTVAALSFPHLVFSLISNFIERNRFSVTNNITELLMTYCSCQTVVTKLTDNFR